MGRRKNNLSQREVTQTVDQRQAEYDEQTESLERDTEDIETLSDTRQRLDLDGTQETAEQVERSMDDSERIGDQEFEEDEQQLDDTQDQGEQFEQDLHERLESTESDLGKISDASSRIHSERINREQLEAKEALVRGIEFLNEHERRAQEGREKTERDQEEYNARVRAAQRRGRT